MAISEILDFDYIYMVLSELNKINDMRNLSDIEYRVYLEMLIVRIVYDGGESLLNKSGFDLQSEVKNLILMILQIKILNLINGMIFKVSQDE